MFAFMHGERESARSILEESLSLYHLLGDKNGATWPRSELGWLAIAQGDYSTARSYLEENLTFLSEQGNRGRRIAYILMGLGTVAHLETDFAAAQNRFEQALDISRLIGDQYQISKELLELALTKLEQGNLSQAKRHVSESLILIRELDEPLVKIAGLIVSARLALAHDELSRAARLCGTVESLFPLMENSGVYDVEPPAHARTIETLKQRLDPIQLAKAWAEGKGMALDDALQLALET